MTVTTIDEHRSLHLTRGDAPVTILLVDDDPDCRMLIRDAILECKLSNDIHEVSNGAEALELFAARKDEIGLLITDIVMPAISGRVLAEKCCALRKTLKVIYVSGYTRDSLLSQQTFEDGTEFIEKPFTRDGVLARIADVLSA